MNSCLYECQVLHARFAPKTHRFAYRIFLFAIDLDEVNSLHRQLRLFSAERRNLYAFRSADYLPADEPLLHSSPPAPASATARLKSRVVAHLAAHGVNLSHGRVVLVTLPRVFGYLFNPVSFYFCYDSAGCPVAALAEVTNTFREMKPYTLKPASQTSADLQETGPSKGATFRLRVPKHFYVSPFSDVDVAFDFRLQVPGEQLRVQIDDYAAGQRTLASTLAGRRRPLTDARLAAFTLKYPLITLKIVGLIHWHALRLWLKRVPWFAKAARPADQRGLYRPHRSLTTAHASLPPPPSTAAFLPPEA